MFLAALSPAQRIAAGYLTLLALAVLSVALGAMVDLPGIVVLVLTDFVPSNYAFFAGGLGTLWTVSLVRKFDATGSVSPSVAMGVTRGVSLLALFAIYFAGISKVFPAGASGFQIAVTFAAIAAVLFPAFTEWFNHAKQSEIPSFVVCVLIVAASATVTSPGYYPELDPALIGGINLKVVAGHVLALIAAAIACGVLLSRRPTPPVALAASPTVATPAPAAAPDETWEERVARQNAARAQEERDEKNDTNYGA